MPLSSPLSEQCGGGKSRYQRSKLEFTIVTGLPHSGMTLLMDMLRAAGMPTLGEQSFSSICNAQGHWSYAELSQFVPEKESLPKAAGHASILPYQILAQLPLGEGDNANYRILHLHRPLSQIRASRAARANGLSQNLEEEYSELKAALEHLQKSPVVDLLKIDYPDLVLDPTAPLRELANFFKGRLPIPQALVLPIKPELFHHRE